MNKAEATHIADKHYKKLEKYSSEITSDFDQEAIHQFRVEFKKLRAFLRLLRLAPEVNQELRVPRKLKKMYVQAGILRDLQLQQEQVREAARSEIKKPAEYYYLLYRKIEKQKHRIRKHFSVSLVKHCKAKTNSFLPACSTLPTLESYKENKLQNIRSVISAGHFLEGDLHAIRKILKDLFYNSRVYHEKEQGDESEKKEQKDLDDLLDALGSFQDKCTAISLVKPRWLQKMPGYSRQLPLRIKEKWIKEKQSMKKVLIERLNDEYVSGQFQKNRARKFPGPAPGDGLQRAG